MRWRLLGDGTLLALLAACGAETTAGFPSGSRPQSVSDYRWHTPAGVAWGRYRSADGESWEQGEAAMVIASATDQPVLVAGHENLYRSNS